MTEEERVEEQEQSVHVPVCERTAMVGAILTRIEKELATIGVMVVPEVQIRAAGFRRRETAFDITVWFNNATLRKHLPQCKEES
jgi:hypothetical protein